MRWLPMAHASHAHSVLDVDVRRLLVLRAKKLLPGVRVSERCNGAAAHGLAHLVVSGAHSPLLGLELFQADLSREAVRYAPPCPGIAWKAVGWEQSAAACEQVLSQIRAASPVPPSSLIPAPTLTTHSPSCILCSIRSQLRQHGM